MEETCHGCGKAGRGPIPLSSILSHKGRGGHFQPWVALHRSMKTRNDTTDVRR